MGIQTIRRIGAGLKMSTPRSLRINPNRGVNRSPKQLCCLVPVAPRAPAPGYAER